MQFLFKMVFGRAWKDLFVTSLCDILNDYIKRAILQKFIAI